MSKEGCEETTVQNKVALAAFHVATYVGIVAVSSQFRSSLLLDIVTHAGAIPTLMYFLYLLFLPKRYRPDNKKHYAWGSLREMPDERIDRFFDTASLLYPYYLEVWAVSVPNIWIWENVLSRHLAIENPWKFVVQLVTLVITIVISNLLLERLWETRFLGRKEIRRVIARNPRL